ncbi:speckle targeted PIP5K1A-regulated poly(A) polymerase-like [Cydia amplana]|uniref:speckle targeted PIP5K1A-regulated poly(A) polymerase-like n=1 Tax=Cydia amplana TaxID=1869771 RepID=UPI002FE52BEA
MSTRCDFSDISWMCLKGTFEEQFEQLFCHVRLSAEQAENDLLRLYEDVMNTVGSHWPGCELSLFGSLHGGTALKTSDVDYYLQIPDQNMPVEEMCKEAKAILSRRPDVFKILAAIAHDVPCRKVTILHLPSNRECDLIITSPELFSKEKNYIHLLHHLLHLDKKIRDLVVLVKYWAIVHKLLGPYFRNYIIILMMIFYLQYLNVLPSIRRLQTNVPYIFWRNWNVAFEEFTHFNNIQSSLRQLLMGFFQFYSAYDFEENVISVFTGRSIARKSYKDISGVSEDFELYKDNLRRKLCEPIDLSTPMCVQDVFRHNRNCAYGVSPVLFQNIRMCLKSAAQLCGSESDETFLLAILTKPN